MKLWTWHTPDFSLTSGNIDHRRSSYYQSIDSIPTAYAELAKRVGTNQIIWCYLRSGQYERQPEDRKVEWVLDVPDDKVLGVIDNWVWERIIGSKAYPPDFRTKWVCEAMQEGRDCEAHLECKIQEYLNRPPPKGDWWLSLLLESVAHDHVTGLVKHPVPHQWVVRAGVKAG